MNHWMLRRVGMIRGCRSFLVGALLIACHGQGDGQSSHSQSGIAAGNCADPIILEAAVPLSGQTTAKASDAISGDDPTCVGYATHGAERVYKVNVPAKDQTKLHLDVTPDDSPAAGAFDPVIYLSEDCTAQLSCAAAQDSRGGGGRETLEFVNSSGQDKAFYVVVDGYEFQPNGGGYTLAATLGLP